MRKITIIVLFTVITFNVFAQDNTKKMPSVSIKDIDGKEINVSEIKNNGKPIIFMFWATWCGPCVKELNNTAELYEEWRDDLGVKIYAVSIDDSRAKSKIKPFVEGKRWEYDVLLDPNQELMRAVGFSNPPFTALLNGKGEIVYTHNSYIDGDEYVLEEHLMELVEK